MKSGKKIRDVTDNGAWGEKMRKKAKNGKEREKRKEIARKFQLSYA